MVFCCLSEAFVEDEGFYGFELSEVFDGFFPGAFAFVDCAVAAWEKRVGFFFYKGVQLFLDVSGEVGGVGPGLVYVHEEVIFWDG